MNQPNLINQLPNLINQLPNLINQQANQDIQDVLEEEEELDEEEEDEDDKVQENDFKEINNLLICFQSIKCKLILSEYLSSIMILINKFGTFTISIILFSLFLSYVFDK